MYKVLKPALFFVMLLLIGYPSFSQDTTNVDDDQPQNFKMKKGFQVGFFVGTCLANKYTAALYNGYGLDVYGHQNTFINSLMYQQIVNINGGYNGYPDRIAQALGVNHGDWRFDDPSFMPYNVKYSIAFTAGVQTRFAFTTKDAILFNANTARINLGADFTIATTPPVTGNNFQNASNLRSFPMIGAEQRVVMQLGIQHIFGDDEDRVNFFVEGGLNVNLAKLMKNQININGLIIDLTSTYAYQFANYSAFNSKYLSGVGLGGFLGFGFNVNISPKWLLQFVYNPSFDKINIGAEPKYTFQNALGIRGYYCF